MKKFQVIKCKTCNKVFAACIDQHADDDWKEECDQYLKEGNSIVETMESIGNVFDDSPLNPCCGKPAVVRGTMKPTEQAIAILAKQYANSLKSDEGIVRHASDDFTAGFKEAISQMQPEWVTCSERNPEFGIEVLGYHKDWIDEDFNPDGICVCYFQDEEKPYWIVAKYCNYHDEWHTRYSHDAGHSLGDKFGGHDYIDSPSHWKVKPQPPTK